MSSAPIQLSYALPRRPRRVVWRILKLIIALAALTLIIKFWPTILRRGKILYWQHQAMNFTMPPTAVVIESGKLDRHLKAGMSPEYITPPNGPTIPMPAVNYFARPWRELDALVSATPAKPGAVLYLHERHASGGKPRLVSIMSRYVGCGMSYTIAEVYEPGSPLREPLRMFFSPVTTPLNWGATTRELKVYAGQSDPNDPSHFTIAYKVEGFSGTVDGWLDANDVIMLKPRNRTPLYAGEFDDEPTAATAGWQLGP